MSIHPIPKPEKGGRRKGRVDMSDLAYPKEHMDRDAAYRDWVRNHRCLLWSWEPCEGKIEAAHLQRGGRSLKGSDYSCIPLCGLRHHKLLDGNSLDWEVIAYLWRKCFELFLQWHRSNCE